MTGQNINKKQINQNNSTWHVLKQIRKQEIISFFFAAGQKPWKFEQAKKIELILVNTPINNNYYNKIPKKFISNYYAIIKQFSNRIKFYDYHSIDFLKDCWGDGDHLNSIGARKLTLLINERINKQN